MVINHNIPALFTHLSMRRADRSLSSAMQRLATGLRINSARDDAAGLAIANKLNYQVGGLNQASENASHGVSLIQTAEGALTEVHNMLQRLRELAVYAATDTLTHSDRSLIQDEVEQLTAEIHMIAHRTEFNRMRILNGEADRITEHIDPAGMLTRGITSTLLISPAVPPGTLEYDIEEVGRHAVLDGLTWPLLDADFVPLPPTPIGYEPPIGEALIVNGIKVRIEYGETNWDGFVSRLNIAFSQAGITPMFGAAGNFLVTDIAGSDQFIQISGNVQIMEAMFGAGAGPVIRDDGSDARVEIVELADINDVTVPGSDTLAASGRGNKVFIRGANGEDIRLNLQVSFDPDLGDFVFGNGDPAPTDLNGEPALDGMVLRLRNFGPLMLQIGPSHNTAMPVQISRLNAETLGLVEYINGERRLKLNYQTHEGATRAIGIADDAIETVSRVRARLGAFQNRLESTVQSLDVAAENTEVSRSRIQDADVAKESTRLAQYNVMFQAALAVLGQANQRPQQLISLLQ